MPTRRLAAVAVLLAGCSSAGHLTTHATTSVTPTVTMAVATTTVPTTPVPTTAARATTTSTTSGPRPAPTTSASGVRGTITAGPTCPVERAGQPCPPRPVQTEVRLVDGARVVVTGRSGADGTFSLTAPPGTYQLQTVQSGPFPRCPAKTVTVTAGHYATADLMCDTGIR